MKMKQNIQCTNEDCLYEWTSHTLSDTYVTCPKCRGKVPVYAQKQRIIAKLKERLDKFEGNIKKKKYNRKDIGI